jgi:putative YhdH/YhfP family quinone oxidoreductase
MNKRNFRALVVEETEQNYVRSVKSRTVDELPAGELLVRVAYSSLNYKDALSCIGNKGVTKNYPHTPGIDAAGTVEHSESPEFKEGDAVIVTGYDLGMNTAGGFGQYIRVPAEWALKSPAGLSMREAMALGTAGVTAGISVSRLVERVRPEAGEVLVSGATGGVGSMSVAILSRLGYRVVALTGKIEEQVFLERLGAGRILPRQAFQESTDRPLLKAQWAGGIDTVGGVILENLIKSTHPQGIVTCCGNVASADLHLTVYPFILRGVSLVGVDSQHYPMADRISLWKKLADAWKPDMLSSMCTEITLDDLDACIDRMLAGKLKGRILVNMQS